MSQIVVKGGNAAPIGFRSRARAGMARSNGCLHSVGTSRRAEFLGTLERCETTADEELVPARAVLIEEQNRLAGTGARM